MDVRIHATAAQRAWGRTAIRTWRHASSSASVSATRISMPMETERGTVKPRGCQAEAWYPHCFLSPSATPLQLAVPLRVHLAAVEDPEPERDGQGTDDQERPDVVPERAERRAVEDRGADALERVRRRRDRRDPLHPLRQHLDRVVDARDDEQHPLGDEA